MLTILKKYFPFINESEVERLNDLRVAVNDPRAAATKYAEMSEWDEEMTALARKYFDFLISNTESENLKN